MTRSTAARQALVFDMDGVIFDTEPIWLEAETTIFAKRGKRFSPLLAREIMGVPGPAAMKIVADRLGLTEDPNELTVELNAEFHQLLETRLTLMPGLLERLDFLDELGVAKAVATSTERHLARHMLGRFGLMERFRSILTRDDIQFGKPHPEIYRRSCDAIGVEPGRTLVIEDSLAGCASAREAGCFVVALRHPLTHDLEFPDADMVIDHHLDDRVSTKFQSGHQLTG